MLSRKNLIEHGICLSILILINIFYFLPQFQGKVVQQGDIVSSSQAYKYLSDLRKETGETYLWNPSQFGGMPVLASAPSENNLIYKSYSILRLGLGEPAGLFIAGSLMGYLMFVLLGFSPWISLICTIPMLFATGNMGLWEAGHNSKIRTLIFTPLLIGGVLQIFERRKYMLGFVLLSLGFSFSFFTRHPQMTYYILLVFLIYGLVFLYQTFRSKEWLHLSKGAGLVVLAIGLGLATSATRAWSLYSYSKSTMRGQAILQVDDSVQQKSSSNVDGLAWDYAMQWSNNFEDIMATFIPGFAGGGSGEHVSTQSETYKSYRLERAPLYWGGLPFTEAPLYFGAIVWFLFFLGFFKSKGNIKWWMGIGMIWMILLSMGRYFGNFNQIIFELFPFYSKFRAPQTILNTTPFFITLLGAYGLREYLKPPKASKKKLKSKAKSISFISSLKADKALIYAFSLTGIVALCFALFGSLIYEFSTQGDQRYIQQGMDVTPFIDDRISLFNSDSWRSFFLVFSAALLIALFQWKKFNKLILFGGLLALTLFDLLNVNTRYLNHDDFVRKRVASQNLEPRPVDLQIQNSERNRFAYRVQDLTINTKNSSEASAFHNTIGGYSPAKLQRAEDLFNRHIAKNNMSVYNMLNTKYFIVRGEEGAQVQLNNGALGNAWFVQGIKKVNTPNQEIEELGNFDPANEAILLESEFPGYIQSESYSNIGTIEIKNYGPNSIIYSSSNEGDGLAVFSEMWYAPGWLAYIDGKEVEHVRVNYALRALLVPAGQHEIKFEFKPASYYVGEQVSLASSLFLILCMLGIGYMKFKRE